jgi:hypothetical protein
MSRSARPVSSGLVLALVVTVSVLPGQASADQSQPTGSGQGKPDLSGVSIVSIETTLGGHGPEAKLELRNRSTQSVTYGGYSASAVSYSRQCLRNGEWQDDKSMGWCGVGLEAQTLPAGDKVQFEARLCPDGSGTRIGLGIGTPAQQRGEVVWSEPITPPTFADADPLPEFHFDEHEATSQAFRRLRERNAIGELGKTWKMQPPRVAGLQVSGAQAGECLPAGRYVIAQYQYLDKPGGGPNSIVFEVPYTNEWKLVGELSASSMDEAIAYFRAGKLCDSR